MIAFVVPLAFTVLDVAVKSTETFLLWPVEIICYRITGLSTSLHKHVVKNVFGFTSLDPQRSRVSAIFTRTELVLLQQRISASFGGANFYLTTSPQNYLLFTR